MIMIDAKEKKIIEDTLEKIEEMVKDLLNEGFMGFGLSLKGYSDTLRAVMGLKNEEE